MTFIGVRNCIRVESLLAMMQWKRNLPENSSGIIGYIGLHQIGFDVVFTPRVEIGWRLAADYHNQG